MDDSPFAADQYSRPLGREFEQNAREGLRALFHWLVFPFPLALIPLGWLSQFAVLMFVPLLLVVAFIWATRAWGAWRGKIGPAWNAFRDWLERFEAFRVMRQSRAAKAEGKTALRAVAMDTPEGDIQVSVQRDAWTTQIGRLEAIYNRDGAQELLLRQLRRNVAGLDAAEATRHATPQGLGAMRMASLGAVGRPQGFVGLPVPSLTFPFSWALAAVLAVTNLGTFWLWDRARDQARENAEFREGNRQVAEQWRENAQGWRDHARRLEADGTVTANVLAEREAAIARARAQERRTRRELEDIARDTPPAWFDSVRPSGADPVGRAGADAGGGPGAGDPG